MDLQDLVALVANLDLVALVANLDVKVNLDARVNAALGDPADLRVAQVNQARKEDKVNLDARVKTNVVKMVPVDLAAQLVAQEREVIAENLDAKVLQDAQARRGALVQEATLAKMDAPEKMDTEAKMVALGEMVTVARKVTVVPAVNAVLVDTEVLKVNLDATMDLQDNLPSFTLVWCLTALSVIGFVSTTPLNSHLGKFPALLMDSPN